MSATKRRTSESVSPRKKANTGSAYQHDLVGLNDVATRLRIKSVTATTKAGTGHPSSCASAADLCAALFFDPAGMHYHPLEPRNPNNDRFIMSKGHAAPLLYACWNEAGLVKESELLKLREIDSDLEGHPTPKLSFCDVATGSLGQGLGAAAGMAYVSKKIDEKTNRFYCLLGDGETAEGSVWEAMHFAGYYHLDNLIAIVDVNRLGQSQATSLGHDMETYHQRFASFGWNALVIDGNNMSEVVNAFATARNTVGKPTAILAKTLKGAGLPDIADADNWHGKPLSAAQSESTVAHLKSKLSDGSEGKKLQPTLPSTQYAAPSAAALVLPAPTFRIGEEIATRLAYGNALALLGQNDPHARVVGLDGDTKNSTFSINFMKVCPQRFIECFIAEQNLVSVGIGAGVLGKVPFCSTFGAFFARAFDQVRMGAISQANIKLVGSHSGVSIGEDGPSQMALEDFAIFRSVPNALVLYPSDGVSTYKAVEMAANYKGIVYIRTSRPNFKVIYPNDEVFTIGKSKVVRHHANDKVTVVAGGVTLHEAIAAADQLAKEGVHIRIVDIFCIKPVDKATLLTAARATHGKVLCVEDHYPEGGIFESVTSAFAEETNIKVSSLAVHEVPRSGKPNELLAKYGINAAAIVAKVKTLL